nr:hypothetical protein CFP56_52424 [Quercus suber]
MTELEMQRWAMVPLCTRGDRADQISPAWIWLSPVRTMMFRRIKTINIIITGDGPADDQWQREKLPFSERGGAMSPRNLRAACTRLKILHSWPGATATTRQATWSSNGCACSTDTVAASTARVDGLACSYRSPRPAVWSSAYTSVTKPGDTNLSINYPS